MNACSHKAGRCGLLVVCLALALVALAQPLAAAPLAQGTASRVETWTLNTVADWRAGFSSGLLVANNVDGELRLADDQVSGSFVSAPFAAQATPVAAGATWRADTLAGTAVDLALRARASEPPKAGVELTADEGWGPWQVLVAADAQAADGSSASAALLALPADTQYLQLRARFTSSVARASATLNQVSVALLRGTTSAATFATGLPRRPIVSGPATLTPRPTLVARESWAGQAVAAPPQRATPRGIIIHQIDATTINSTTLDFVRALLTYQTKVLGWDDLSYHYLLDNEGTLFEGRAGGPTARVEQLNGGDTAVHVALIVPQDQPPSENTQAVLINLLAWLGQAYTIAPTGQHAVVTPDGRTTRANIIGHGEVVRAAPDPYPPLRDLLPQLRTRVDSSTVRARWYFAEGNTAAYSQRFSFFNPSSAAADARVTLIGAEGSPQTEIVLVPAGSRADLVVNDVVSDASSLAAIVESSAPILAERSLNLTTDIDGGPGIDQLSRVWYFAEGSTMGDAQTFLVLFNPQNDLAEATVTYMRSDGTNLEQTVQVPPQQRIVVSVADNADLRGQNFGMRVVSSQPIAAERTMRFGPNQSGLHTGRGIVELSRDWYFAEGTTETNFSMRLLVLNPNDQPASTSVSFMGPDGHSETRRYAIPPRAQLSVLANDVIPNLGVSTHVAADRPLAVERALYFRNGQAGSIGAGAPAPAYTWRFVEGRTSDATLYLLFSNPGMRAANVQVDFAFGDGATATQRVTVGPGARYTMAVDQLFPDESSVAATVRATVPIVAERSFYPGGGERGGSTAIGIPE